MSSQLLSVAQSDAGCVLQQAVASLQRLAGLHERRLASGRRQRLDPGLLGACL